MAERGTGKSRLVLLQPRETKDEENMSEEEELVIDETSEEGALDLRTTTRLNIATTSEETGKKERMKRFSRLDTVTQFFETKDVTDTVVTLPGMRLYLHLCTDCKAGSSLACHDFV